MKKLLLLITIISLLVPISANAEEIDFEGNGFQKMKTTAYYMGTTCASGVESVPGTCATDYSHRGMIAEVYTTKGTFLGYYRCEDAGGTEAIKNGYVIDIKRTNYTQCYWYMKVTEGEVWVRYLEGEG